VSIKTILFGLFLYVCLVWVGVAYWASGTQSGLLWTAMGLIAVLAFLILARIVGWWRLRRARRAARPAAQAKPAPTLHPDDAALLSLLDEANRTLAEAPGYAGAKGRKPLYDYPVHLLIGPEGSGKTSTFVNSGIEPQLLAGQVAGSAPIVPTRVGNIWLARNAIFIELAGRLFAGDVSRWKDLLTALRWKATVSRWKKLWGQPERQMELRAVVAFCEVKEFIGAQADPQRLERLTRDWHERLGAIAEVFGSVPVYQILTKSDAVLYFSDFFRRLPDSGAAQILGCTLSPHGSEPSHRGEVFAEAEARRLTAAFRSLYHSLAARRLAHLAHEPEPARRPAIYEFPREIKRIRSPLVQFLTEAFRPNPLRANPELRGFFLSGTRRVEAAAAAPGLPRAEWEPGSFEATRLFRAGDATQILRPSDFSKTPVPAERKGMLERWMFVTELFRDFVLAEPPRRQQFSVDLRTERMRQYVFGGTAAACALLCVAFLISWTGNRDLLRTVEAAGMFEVRSRGNPSFTELQALDSLRVEVEQLRRGPGLSLRWGLYTGNKVLDSARTAYFRRFRWLFLDDWNARMVSSMANGPETGDAYEAIYRVVKTHLIISSGGCPVDANLVSRVLKEQERNEYGDAGQQWHNFADRQIDFYASELAYGNPLPVPLDAGARDHARQYLTKVKGVEGIYQAILASAERGVTERKRLADFASNYAQVLSGPAEMNAAFTPQGWALVEKASKESKTASADSCVIGTQALKGGGAQAIQQRYLREYIERWSSFLAGFSVSRYTSAEDAAKKLAILADYKSPLLALFYMTSKGTEFQTTSAPGVIEKALEPIVKTAQKAVKKVNDVRPDEQPRPELATFADIPRAFQPVQLVVPPASQTWVTEKNNAYVDALRQLSGAMHEIARGQSLETAIPAATQNYEKALDAAQKLTQGFTPGAPGGVDATAKRLLEEPILNARLLIPGDPGKLVTDKINGALRNLCSGLRSTLGKYPFIRTSKTDATIAEFDAAFAPGRGSIWKFQASSLDELVMREKSMWKQKDPAKKPAVTPEMLTLLNRAQQMTDVFYANGAATPQFAYSLRPRRDPVFQGWTLELYADGKLQPWKDSSLQTSFSWPAAGGTEPGARIRIGPGGALVPIVSQRGVWGIFRIMDFAQPRTPGNRIIQWKYSGEGQREIIEPAPVQLEIVELPAGIDVFDAKFFDGLGCPVKGAQ
jgi:type VI secretion system protein ImpL